ncbi:MAG TPA: cyclic nucleotide-binding domain-containing protein [Mycobacteriales bacterium]|nr:cyclic nucleotide-binding domain-containing protein [Mycobacteriales bacterium]
MRNDAKIERLAAIPLFAGSRPRELEGVARLCTEVDVPAGRTLCREGEPGQEFFVLEQGTVQVTSGGRQVATLGPGDFFGELALLDAGPRNATVTAETDVTVLVVSRQEFMGLLEEEPMVAVRMLPAIGARLRAGAQPAQEQPPVV